MQTSRIALIILSIIAISCQSEKKQKETIKIGNQQKEISAFDTGKKIFKGKGKCYTCHKIDKNSIGPSIHKIVEIYKEQDADLIAFLKQQAEPIVDPETYAVMKTNFAIIKTFSEEELKALEVYMTEVQK
ncbi:c-type cytochrome [Aquimarina sp. U1-2]|uniref:c-type cytochrome n=1 Tax=Aquimarina sp. U1-2 TaxID=2823141 RepID=UPI001AECFC60|nr:c-type cytochrome [Aquimarina sp. U1-2]MBP2834136.1 c-type cytochrome [Aquimarina sp. U1-2]